MRLSQWLYVVGSQLEGQKLPWLQFIFQQKHYNFADLSFTKLFSKHCRYYLDFRIFCAS